MARHHRIRPEAVIVGYALARMDKSLLEAMGWSTWNDAYVRIAQALSEEQNSIKLLRDEFDVFFPNGRRGWLNRAPHPSRLSVLNEFNSVSDDALIEIVRRLLNNDHVAVDEVIRCVAEPPQRVANVAERLRTGRQAEEHFMKFCHEIIEVPSSSLSDMRGEACGYDFESSALPEVAIEVKGIAGTSGDILFTDKEWSEANRRSRNYWVVLVGNLKDENPTVRVVRDAVANIEPKCTFVSVQATVWRARASVVV